MDEFELIRRCFGARTTRRAGTVLGIGDDAALLDTGGLPLGHARATTSFSGRDDAAGMARHAFGAAFIRLAAQAVTPRWATLGLTLEACDPDWIESFATAAAALCDACEIELIGGDTTRGSGRATVFALGAGSALPHRSARQPSSAVVRARLPLATAHVPGQAIAALISVCTDLSARGAGIRCDETPGRTDASRARTLTLVAHADAAGMDALRAVADRLRPDPRRPESDD